MSQVGVNHGPLSAPAVPLRHSLHVDAEYWITDPDRPELTGGTVDLRGCGCEVRGYFFKNDGGLIDALVVEHEHYCAWFRALHVRTRGTPPPVSLRAHSRGGASASLG